MHQDLNVWRTDRRTEGCISERGYSSIPHNVFRNKMGSVIKSLRNYKKSQFFWWCDLDLWHLTMKSWSIRGTITTIVCTKFENNPPSAFWVIVLIICVEHKNITPPPSFNNLKFSWKNDHSRSNISQVTSQMILTATNKWTRKHGSTIPQTNIEAP